MALNARRLLINLRNINKYYRPWFAVHSKGLTSFKKSNLSNNIKHNINFKSNWLHTTSTVNKSVAFKLSDIGEGIREVVVKEWFVKVGDKVQQFDNICEVQSDKAAVTITSRYDGVVTRLYHQVDETALVGQPLVDIELESSVEEEISSVAEEAKPTEAAPVVAKEGIIKGKVLTTPAVRRIAAQFKFPQITTCKHHAYHRTGLESVFEHRSWEFAANACEVFTAKVGRYNKQQFIQGGRCSAPFTETAYRVDLSSVKATGRNGRVLKEDVLGHLNINSDKSNDVPSDISTESVSNLHSSLDPSASLNAVTSLEDRIVPISGFTRAMVKSMTEAMKIPHFVFSDEYEVTKLVQSRKNLKELAQREGVKLTYMPIIIKAASQGLKKFPILNSSLDATCENIIYKAHHNIGVAMDTPNGLVVPVIKNVQLKSIMEIARELNILQDKGSKGQLGLSDLTGGTFSISNIGIIGGTYMKPIIFPPQVSIGAIGKIQVLPRFDSDGNVVKAHILSVSWSADHRVIDGVTMAKFSNELKEYLEEPCKLILDL